MSTVTQFTTLEDAYYYFFQAVGTSDTLQGSTVKQRHLRTAVLLGWVAIDDAVASFALEANIVWPRECKGPRLLPKLQFVFKKLSVSLDTETFNRHRRVRNELTHPKNGSEATLTTEKVNEGLAFCKTTMKIMYPRLVVGEEAKGRLSQFR